MAANYTPMINQYRKIKNCHQNEILFFRLGDFYEMFFEDAEVASRELDITLTSRDGGLDSRIPMCGVPYHAADSYINRLINKGYKVAICEQVEDPKTAKGIVKREVIKIITPGTNLSEAFLTEKSNNFLIVVHEEEAVLYMAAADISTGEFIWASFSGNNRITGLCDQLFRLMPSELATAGTIDGYDDLCAFIRNRIPGCTFTSLDPGDRNAIQKLPESQFPEEELPESGGALLSIGCLLDYLHETVKADLSHLNHLTKYDSSDYLILDATALRHLEITRNTKDGGKRDTLMGVLDFTKTAMGSRLLRRWLEYPLIAGEKIKRRQNAVAELLSTPLIRQSLQEALGNVYDFERILTRIDIGSANARDLTALKVSLMAIPQIIDTIAPADAQLLQQLHSLLNSHSEIVELIHSAIIDTPPLSVREGGMIKSGYDAELDELRSIATDSKKWVQEMELRERESTGIKSLKVGYNKVFGYYIEVTHTHTESVPDRYTRKQTLANAERYITPELKQFESKILSAQERIVNLEYYIFTAVRDRIKEQIKDIQQTARHIAALDTMTSLAEAAARYNYIRPDIKNDGTIVIKDGRHPVVERLLSRELFIPNDVGLDHGDCEIMIITGPNMAGKSTYMRQIALLVLMAQVGSFIPAREASISPVDRIFTRVGASDDLASGQSTFMVEMNEVAQILKNATRNSLIILDEIGRGTSTFDGMSIAKAVIEYIKDKIKAKTLFATHYHELTDLAEQNHGIKNFSVAVKERGKDVVFLRRIIPGGADKSYGIHVAQLAGLPGKVVSRAKELLSDLESNGRIAGAGQEQSAATTVNGVESMSLFLQPVIEELLDLDIMTMSPLEALSVLYKIQGQLKQEAGNF